MSEFSLILVLRKENKQNSNMTWQKYKLKSGKLTPFGGIFSIMEQFFILTYIHYPSDSRHADRDAAVVIAGITPHVEFLYHLCCFVSVS